MMIAENIQCWKQDRRHGNHETYADPENKETLL